jgi:hypothetical protein
VKILPISRGASPRSPRALLALLVLILTSQTKAAAPPDATDLPDAKPVPEVQVVPLPYEQASFQHLGRELTRYHFGPSLKRPFLYPIEGPAGHPLTRMGHPHDPNGHRHHNSIWISHHDVGGVDFWSDGGAGQIVCQRVEQYEDGPTEAWMLSTNAWQDAEQKMLLLERRRVGVRPLVQGEWFLSIDLQFEAPSGTSVTIGQTPFGMIGVRMAKTIGVHDGGGRILNSGAARNEEAVFRKPARWVDYSGPVAEGVTGGIALMDHPANPDHPTAFHVRNDGWMGACLTLDRPLVVQAGKPLRLCYGLWIHSGVSSSEAIDARWQAFAQDPLATMQRRN